jgi:hypothetical protein
MVGLAVSSPVWADARAEGFGVRPVDTAGLGRDDWTRRDAAPADGREDSQFAEIEGVIHGFRPLNDNHLTFDVMAGAMHVLVTLPAPWRGPVPTNLLDARVRLRGVCGTEFNPRRQLIGLQLPSTPRSSRHSRRPTGRSRDGLAVPGWGWRSRPPSSGAWAAPLPSRARSSGAARSS